MKFLLLFAILSLAVSHADDGTKTIYAPNLDDYECNAAEWHFVITQADPARMPGFITVTWDCGDPVEVPLDGISGSTGHYYHHGNLACSLVEVRAEIYVEWGGIFRVSHGPCDAPTPTPTPTDTPTPTPTNTPTPTETPIDTPTPTPTDAPTDTPTPTGTLTATSTPTRRITPTPTDVPFVPEASAISLMWPAVAGLATYVGWQIRRRLR